MNNKNKLIKIRIKRGKLNEKVYSLKYMLCVEIGYLNNQTAILRQTRKNRGKNRIENKLKFKQIDGPIELA